jgi:hypothetical protein
MLMILLVGGQYRIRLPTVPPSKPERLNPGTNIKEAQNTGAWEV